MNRNTDYRIGKVIKLIRLQKGMSQDILGKNTGLSKGLISQIENDKVSPSFSNIKKIAVCLGIELSRLFYYCEANQFNQCLIIKKGDQHSLREQGVTIRECVAGLESCHFQPRIIELETGNKTKAHNHTGLEFIYLFNGKIDIIVAGETYTLLNQEYAILEGIVSHQFKNLSLVSVEIMSILINE
ncbi:helix-turn-helix domain-containing protein [Chlamydiota bacterium]